MLNYDFELLIQLFLVFVPLSLAAFGGGISIIAAMQYQVVDSHAWMSQADFLTLFAIARSSPGPGSMMLTTLVGLKVAGIPGAISTTFGMFLPSTALCIASAVLLRRYRNHKATKVLEKALLPIGAGLLIAGVASLGIMVSMSKVLLSIAILSAVACLTFPNLHPIVVIVAGAVVHLAFVLLM